MIHEVGLDLDRMSTGRVTLDGKPLSVVELRVVAEVGQPPLVTFTVRAAVHGQVEAEGFTAAQDIREGDAVTIAQDGRVRLSGG